MRRILTVLGVAFFAVTSHQSNGQQPPPSPNTVGAPEPTKQSTVPGTQETQSTDAVAPEQGNAAEQGKGNTAAAPEGDAAAAPNNNTPRPSNRASRRSRFLSSRRPSYRLARAPAMFGDSILTDTFDVAGVGFGTFLGQERNKIADNGSVLPRDRNYLDFRYFHNAVSFDDVGGVFVSEPVERYRFGFERTISVNGNTSVEVRIPLTGGGNTATPGLMNDADGFGNIAVILKHLLYRSDNFLVSGGVGINTPTGEDIRFRIPGLFTDVRIRNEAWHIQPFLGFLSTPDNRLFVNGFAQLDVAANGSDVLTNGINEGALHPATVLNVDIGAGYWLVRHASGNGGHFTGVAVVAETHYTGNLTSADSVLAAGGDMRVGGLIGQMHILNATVGLHGTL
ncbi:MAG: hypothetical protein GY826_18945, partial [Fuerstiella sp.]|nr:hypothetical protein [Fuerstiella sp.]